MQREKKASYYRIFSRKSIFTRIRSSKLDYESQLFTYDKKESKELFLFFFNFFKNQT